MKTIGKVLVFFGIAMILGALSFQEGMQYGKSLIDEPKKELVSINKLRDYQLDITEDICYIYDNNRLVGKCKLDGNLVEQLIAIDNQ